MQQSLKTFLNTTGFCWSLSKSFSLRQWAFALIIGTQRWYKSSSWWTWARSMAWTTLLAFKEFWTWHLQRSSKWPRLNLEARGSNCMAIGETSASVHPEYRNSRAILTRLESSSKRSSVWFSSRLSKAVRKNEDRARKMMLCARIGNFSGPTISVMSVWGGQKS